MTATLSSFLADDATRSMAALQRYVNAPDPDAVFLDDMLERIEAARRRPCPPRPRTGRALRVLLLSYAGAGNTGADLRTIQTIRHLQRLFGERGERDEGLRIELFALGDLFDHPVLAATPRMPVQLPYVPDAFAAAIPDYDLVLNVEGSTYTSKFSDSLSGMLIGGVALASAAPPISMPES
ncbi:hypothetical protein, partial [Paraburkholderia kururiensis]|uniref:hypothetical protein n=1 Tax=Paraburkholderia kururiensis TaxID=984307 RepID=UPI001300BED5